MTSAVLCKSQESVYQSMSSLVFGMDSAVLETDTAFYLVHCMCVCVGGGDEYLGRAGVQLK